MATVDRKAKTPMYVQTYEQVVERIESGFYEPGQKLPSIRVFANALGVSNTTIELAYRRLISEGYITSKRGSGYIVSAPIVSRSAPPVDASPAYQEALNKLKHAEAEKRQHAGIEFNFWYDAVDATLFPFSTWALISREVFLEGDPRDICLYDERQGLYELRVEIARYLNEECGIRCIPEQVLVAVSTRTLIDSIITLLDPAKTTIAVENPGFNQIFLRLQREGYTLKPIPMFPSPDLRDAEMALGDANVFFATPVSQFPTCKSMPIEVRKNLVEWAVEHHAYIIDNEYCQEFEVGNPRPPALGSLDSEGYVVTLGTFSNSFSPSVCLAYAVMPPSLMMKWRNREDTGYPAVPWQTQASMAKFMREGHWAEHVRRTRTSVIRKRTLIADAVKTYLSEDFDVIIGENSLFILVRARDGRSQEELISAAEQAGARVYPTTAYWYTEPPEDWRYVSVGFAGIQAFKIEQGIKLLAKAWYTDASEQADGTEASAEEPA